MQLFEINSDPINHPILEESIISEISQDSPLNWLLFSKQNPPIKEVKI